MATQPPGADPNYFPANNNVIGEVPPEDEIRAQDRFINAMTDQNDDWRKARDRVAALLAREDAAAELGQEALLAGFITASDIAGLLITKANGDAGLPEQKIEVEYLRSNQMLVLPGALGMKPYAGIPGNEYVVANETLMGRFWKLTRLNFATMRTQTLNRATLPQILEWVNSLPEVPADLRRAAHIPAWKTLAWAGQDVRPSEVEATFSLLSNACQFNCDLRDTGFLYMPDATLSDVAWRAVDEIDTDRFASKLAPFTMNCIAALNYAPCGNCSAAAWTRAYGVSMGLLPDQQSRSVREYVFSVGGLVAENYRTVQAWQLAFPKRVIGLAGNVLSIFGLLHLNKDHTFRTGDVAMQRVGKAYLYTLRTYVPQAEMTELETHMEAILRTGPHPFGLAQTYCLAKHMARFSRLTPALMLRSSTTPPPVQRMMIVYAAMREMDGLPVGRMMIETFTSDLATLAAAIEQVKANAPAYSDLHQLYGYSNKAVLPQEINELVNSHMPCVYGYIQVTHVTDDNQKDGLGLALSLDNVAREARGLVTTYKAVWDKYMNAMQTAELADVIGQLRDARMRNAALAAQGRGA